MYIFYKNHRYNDENTRLRKVIANNTMYMQNGLATIYYQLSYCHGNSFKQEKIFSKLKCHKHDHFMWVCAVVPRCMCNGHGDKCDADTGLSCVCHNNTQTNCNEMGNSDPKCHEKQVLLDVWLNKIFGTAIDLLFVGGLLHWLLAFI